jgi:hypothetical protein
MEGEKMKEVSWLNHHWNAFLEKKINLHTVDSHMSKRNKY